MSGTKHEWAIMAALSAHDGCKSRNRGKHGMWMEAAIAAYLAVMRVVGEGEVRVRAAVCVGEDGEWFVAGALELDTEAQFRESVTPHHCIEFPQYHFIEASVPAWTPPAEETVEGEVVG